MAPPLLNNQGMDDSFAKKPGRVIESLSFKAEGDVSDKPQPTVLSCGGIYVPRRRVPMELKAWNQIVNLSGPELSAKCFAGPPSPSNSLQHVLRKEILN